MHTLSWEQLSEMGNDAKGSIDTIFLHWSAGHYGQPFPEYHINIDQDGTMYSNVCSLTEVLEHTWRRNYGTIAVSLLCCALATTNDLGPEPPTEEQIETMAKVTAKLCKQLELPVSFDYVRTHAEQADIDGYGPATTCERWDLWFLSISDERGSGGDILRSKALGYLV